LKLKEISDVLKSKNIRVIEDFKDTRKPGWKFSEYELKGVPIRIAMGPKDVKNDSVEIFRRDTLSKQNVQIVDITQHIEDTLDSIQKKLFEKAKKFNKENTHYADNFEDFKEKINLGGFVYAHWDGTSDTENTIKKITKATIRTIPLNEKSEKGICVYSGKPSTRRVVFAKSY
jgi:prolyl-tRNA synthetase